MKSLRTCFMLTALWCCLSATAQRKLVVVDWETLVPVDGANVVCKDMTVRTDSLGYVIVPDSSRSLVFSHVNYESRLVRMDEIGDTVFLISKLLNLNEVVVFGKAPYKDEYKELKKQMQLSKTELQLAGAKPDGMNLIALISYLIPKKWKMSPKKRRRERLKRILEEY